MSRGINRGINTESGRTRWRDKRSGGRRTRDRRRRRDITSYRMRRKRNKGEGVE